MIKISITGMTIEIPDEVGALHGLLGSATKVTGAVNTPISVSGLNEPEEAPAEDTQAEDELKAKRDAEEAAKAQARSDAAKKAAATKKANEEKAAAEKAAADKKAAAAAAMEEDDTPGAYTLADVKDRFKELLDKDIDIIPILQHFGAAKVSLLDSARYGEVMDHVKEM